MKNWFLVLLTFLLIPRISLAAEPQTQDTLEPVVVTATRTEIPQQETATSISVITSEEIRQQQAETVLEALRNVPGLDVVQTGSRGNVASVFIRGANSNQTLVLLDGAEINSTTTGAFDFAHLTTENIERIEVLRGAGGTLYGSQAIGGVIHIITKKGEGKPLLNLSAEGGNGRTHRQVLGFRGGTERLGYFFSASRLETDGFRRINDDYQNLTSSGRLDFKITDSARLRGIFHFRKADLGLFNSNNFLGIPDPNARFNLTDYIAKMDYEQSISKTWDYRISGSFFKEYLKFIDDPEPGSFDTTRRDRFRPETAAAEFQTNYRFERWGTTTFGVEFKRRKAATFGTSNGADLGGIDRAIRNIGYYFQQQIRLFDGRLILVPGIRLDDNQNFGTEWSPSFSAAYLIRGTGTKFKLGYAEGFRAPSLNELFFPNFGNPDLGPEKSWEINAGFEQRIFGRSAIGMTYFHREVKDLIVFALPQFQNVASARVDGIELFAKARLFEGFSVRPAYTFLESDLSRGKLLRRPRHRGSVLFNYDHEGFHVNLNINIVGSRDDVDAVTFQNVKQPGYVKVDLASSYKLPWKRPGINELRLYGKIENLLDKKYEEADGFRAPPLNFLIGLRGVFGKE